MRRTLDYILYDIMQIMSVDHRWDVLTVIMLRADRARNRSWPAMRTIAKKACPTSGINGNLGMATRAKKWLLEHGAIELVPYDKRVGPEENLPRNRHIYQLTGVIEYDGKIYPYIFSGGAEHVSGDETTGPEDVTGDEVSPHEVSGDEISPDETNLESSTILDQSNLGSGQESSSIKEDDLTISIFRSLENAKTTLALDRGLTIAWCKYVIWRRDQAEFKKIGIESDYVFKMVSKKEPVPDYETNPVPESIAISNYTNVELDELDKLHHQDCIKRKTRLEALETRANHVLREKFVHLLIDHMSRQHKEMIRMAEDDAWRIEHARRAAYKNPSGAPMVNSLMANSVG